MSPVWLIVVLLAVVAVLLGVSAVSAFRRRAPVSGGLGLLVAVLVLALAGATGAAAWSLARYEALTRETLAAVIQVEPTGPSRFRAEVEVPGGEVRRYELFGEQVWIDAQIVKWHPWANVIGLRTAYRLDRIGGRYRSVDDERTLPRSVEPLHDEDGFASDLYDWVGRQPWLHALVDAQYGSGSYLAADAAARVEVRVSSSGLLMRAIPSDR